MLHLHFQASNRSTSPQEQQHRSDNIHYTSTKVFEATINAIKFLVLRKKFGPSQKFLGPVKVQGIQFQHLKLIENSEKKMIEKRDQKDKIIEVLDHKVQKVCFNN